MLFRSKKLGVNRLLVESPTMVHLFLKNGLMDELFINTSCIYVGGKALSIGQNYKSFESNYHPHIEILKLYMHSPHFMFTRYRVLK